MAKKQPAIKPEENSESRVKISESKNKKTTEEISKNFSNPEQEFMKKCDEEIEQIDKRIKKIDTEWEKKLKMIPKMDDSFAESMCLNALTETLSEDEIAIVKK